MSKLDELESTFVEKTLKEISKEFYGDEFKLGVNEYNLLYKKLQQVRDLGKLEEREALKKMVEGKKKLKGMHYASGYNTALSDLLTELNKTLTD